MAGSNPEQVEADGKDSEIPGHLPGLWGHEEGDQDAGDDVDLVGGAHKDECDDGKVEARVEGDQNQGACKYGRVLALKKYENEISKSKLITFSFSLG